MILPDRHGIGQIKIGTDATDAREELLVLRYVCPTKAPTVNTPILVACLCNASLR